jgi:hypothetical protein
MQVNIIRFGYSEVMRLTINKNKEKIMKRAFVFITAMIFLISFGAVSFAQDKPGDAASPAKASSSTQTQKLVKDKVVTKTAMVEAIDLKTRMVTLKDKDGNLWEIKADARVKNLPQVKVGDEVVAKYQESVVVQMASPGTPLGVTKTETATAAKLGEKPSGKESSQVTVVATIVTIDPGKTYVTLKGPEGKSVIVQVKDPQKLENVKVGDQVSITYTQALAISVQKAPKK